MPKRPHQLIQNAWLVWRGKEIRSWYFGYFFPALLKTLGIVGLPGAHKNETNQSGFEWSCPGAKSGLRNTLTLGICTHD